MEEKDIRIDTYSNSFAEVKMRLTHLPTGLSVNGLGIGRYKLKAALMKELKKKVDTKKEQ